MRPGAMLQILRRAADTEAPLPRQAGVGVAPGRLAAPPCSYHLLPARSAHITARYVCITVVRTATQILAELRASEAADWRTAANKFLPQVGAMDVPPAVAPQLGQGHSLTLACPRMLQSAGVSRRTPCLPPPAGLVWQWGGDADRPSGHRLQVGRPPGVNATALLLRLPFQVAPDTALLLRLPLRVPLPITTSPKNRDAPLEALHSAVVDACACTHTHPCAVDGALVQAAAGVESLPLPPRPVASSPTY